MTALEDFGEMDRECLENLLESVRVDARLNFIGRIGARQEILRVLRNRLYIENHLKNFPQVRKISTHKDQRSANKKTSVYCWPFKNWDDALVQYPCQRQTI